MEEALNLLSPLFYLKLYLSKITIRLARTEPAKISPASDSEEEVV